MKTRQQTIRERLWQIIFESDTPAGKFFDLALIVCIKLSVVAVMLDSVASIQEQYGAALYACEWLFTILFTIEYILRLLITRNPLRYATSFFGIVDLLAIVPTYISLLLPGSQYFLVIRVLRVLRVFRVLKLAQYMQEAARLKTALKASRRKIFVFLYAVINMVVIFGALMYVIEPAENGFTSIPRSIYWAIVTLTTVGYGDISPVTNLGQALAACIMILGYSIIAVPTGIVTVAMSQAARIPSGQNSKRCDECQTHGHDHDALYCKYCGGEL